MTPPTIIGIDPGITGAIACLHADTGAHPDPGCATYDRLTLAPTLTACDQFQPMDDNTTVRRECDGQTQMEVD